MDLFVTTATFFHEFWKRKQAEIDYEWDVADFEEGEVFNSFLQKMNITYI